MSDTEIELLKILTHGFNVVSGIDRWVETCPVCGEISFDYNDPECPRIHAPSCKLATFLKDAKRVIGTT